MALMTHADLRPTGRELSSPDKQQGGKSDDSGRCALPLPLLTQQDTETAVSWSAEASQLPLPGRIWSLTEAHQNFVLPSWPGLSLVSRCRVGPGLGHLVSVVPFGPARPASLPCISAHVWLLVLPHVNRIKPLKHISCFTRTPTLVWSPFLQL